MGVSRQRHISERLRRVIVLILLFVVAPSALLLSVGIMVLAFSHAARDVVFGVLIVSIVATMGIGATATLVYLARAEALAKLQTDFVSKVSHDLRTPLTSIRMFVETLQLGRLQDPERQREALAIISDETARLSSLINRLLDWARMESGRRTYQLVRQPVAPIVE